MQTNRSIPRQQAAASPAAPAVKAVRSRRGGRGYWRLLVLVIIFVAPVAASYYMYYAARPSGRTNFGALIDPQRPLPDVLAHDLDGNTVSLPSLKGQWLLISVSGGQCSTRCEENLYLQRQMRASLGKNQRRLDWVWLISDDAPVPDDLHPALKDATVLRVPQEVLQNWLEPAPGHALADSLYVVDPMGHWMMRFPPALNQDTATQARRDLSRLLYASQGWDKAGRSTADGRQ